MNIQRIVLFLLIGIFLTIGSSESFAAGKVGGDITRTCSAHYEVYPPAGPPYVSPEFLGRGTCFKANDCRRRAHDALRECISKHWSNSASKPSECSGTRVSNYPFTNLHEELGRKVCEQLRVAQLMTTTVKSRIHGDNGCGGSGIRKEELYTHTTQYRIDCSKYVTPATPPRTTQETTDEPRTTQYSNEELHGIKPPMNPQQVILAIVPTIVLPTAGQVFSVKDLVRVKVKLPQGITKNINLLFEHKEGRTWVSISGAPILYDYSTGRDATLPYSFFKKTGEWRVKAKLHEVPNAQWSAPVTFRIR